MKAIAVRFLLLGLFAQFSVWLPAGVARGEESERQKRVLGYVTVNHADLVYRDSEELLLDVDAEADIYVYVFYRQSDGQSMMLFPNGRNAKNFVRAGQSIHPLHQRHCVRFRVRGPSGKETVQVVLAKHKLKQFDELITKERPLAIMATEFIAQWCEDLRLADPSAVSEVHAVLQTEHGKNESDGPAK